MSEGAAIWARACQALDLLAVDPVGLGGMVVRARSGPVRDTFVAAFDRLPQPMCRIHPAMPPDALFGGFDLTHTLATGQETRTQGVLARSMTIVLGMAERCAPDLSARLAQTCNDKLLILLDESEDEESQLPSALSETAAFHIHLDGIGRLEATPPPNADYLAARTAFADVAYKDDAIEQLVHLAVRFGVLGLMRPWQALRTACASAALAGRGTVAEDDIRLAAELIIAPHSTILPEPSEPEAPPPNEDDHNGALPKDQQMANDIPEDIVVDAIRAAIPPDLLDRLQSGDRPQTTRSSGFGARKKGNRRGSPRPARPGRPDGDKRLDLVATLRAAAPWQALRKADPGRIAVRPSDIRIKQYETGSDRLIVYVVDASGSAAIGRLAEAKGAIEIGLASAYSKREHVALIAFRGDTAELILPPTRSLTQVKRRLTALAGGGGTPLATGLHAACDLALRERSRGLSPVLAILTDGRANVAIDGQGDRGAAHNDALAAARSIGAASIASVVIDVGRRPSAALADIASQMAATYVALPFLDAQRLSQTLSAAMSDAVGP